MNSAPQTPHHPLSTLTLEEAERRRALLRVRAHFTFKSSVSVPSTVLQRLLPKFKLLLCCPALFLRRVFCPCHCLFLCVVDLHCLHWRRRHTHSLSLYTRTRARAHTHTHSLSLSIYIYTHTHTHTHTHTLTHTHIHIHTHTRGCPCCLPTQAKGRGGV